jgi:hypothetical protein
MTRKFPSITTIIIMMMIIITTTVVGSMILAEFSLPFVTVLAADDGSNGLFVTSFVSTISSLAIGNNHEYLDGDEDKHGSSSDSHYNVIIETACSIGSIITTDGTNDPDIILGCDLEV